ncbi:MAG: sensor domain-containing diguanylate cyclase, partial [Planctomycetota bacterium]|nr:sensor domain-containing diguanylate cyclase [Planctomycetota bacterium]
FWNKACERISGYTAAETIGRCCGDDIMVHVDERGARLCNTSSCNAARVVREGVACEAELYLKHKDGHRIPVRLRAVPWRDGGGRLEGVAIMFIERFDRQAIEQRLRELERLALLDSLTEVGNRRYAELELESHLNRQRRGGPPFAALMIDIDFFKRINDTYGHAAGDAVLRNVGRTLRDNIRTFDHVARWGGEEFLVLLSDVTAAHMYAIAEKLRALVAASRTFYEGHFIQVAVSIGAALAKRGDTAKRLVERADRLLYRSKAEGRNRVTAEGDAA